MTRRARTLPDAGAYRPGAERAATRGLARLLGVAALLASCTSTPRPSAPPAPATPPAATPRPSVTPAAPAAAPESSAFSWRPAPARLTTRWAADVRPDSVLPEYPRPQLVRPRWRNLNGIWQFDSVSDRAAPPPVGRELAQRILVPFAPEASLSGIGRHAARVVYRRTFRVPDDMSAGERLLLHFGAVDWEATVFVNGRNLGRHTGGYDTFTLDVTDALAPASAEQELVVAVYDPTDAFGQPRGKQVSQPEGIWYTPVTGIWQTVWLEPVPASSVERLAMTPDVAAGVLRLTVHGRGTRAGQVVRAVALANGQTVGSVEGAPGAELRLPVPNPHLWGPDDPFLYDLRVTLSEGSGAGARELDQVGSYFGMRTVGLVRDSAGRAHIALNGRRVFQLGPLDQGWWPDGLYTAPTDAALRSDVELMKQLGFSMVRKHIKVEPARWYYYADKLGLPVWQDMPSGWNDSPEARRHFEREMRAMIEDLGNTPSIVVWVPFNEKWGQFDTKRIVGIVKELDGSRLVNDVSGWQHEDAGDIIDVHRYQGPQAMFGTADRAAVVGEFGGLGFKVAGHAWAGDAWGYGGLFETESALRDRYDLLMKRMWRLRDTHGMSAGVYTQLTDVEVELNGYLTYDRAVNKFDVARTAAVNRGLAPYVLPELADFVDSVRVSITTGAPVEVRYTTDGSEPTATSPAYARAFTVRGNTTVRARSFANGAATAAPESRTEYRRVAGRAPVAAATVRGLVPGIAYAFFRDTTKEPAFRMNWPVRWQLERAEVKPNDIEPAKRGVLPAITLSPADTTVMFGLRYTGYVRVPKPGVYTFTAVSDDGAALWFGDQNVFWSVGQSPKSTETAGDIALQGGVHPITLTYFQAYGPMALELYVEGPEMPRQRVDGKMLFRDRAVTTEAPGPASRAARIPVRRP